MAGDTEMATTTAVCLLHVEPEQVVSLQGPHCASVLLLLAP